MSTPKDKALVAVETQHFPTLVVRIKALFIDTLVLLMVITLATLIDVAAEVATYLKGSIAIAVFVFYDPFFTCFTGGTIGHKFMRVRVKKANNTTLNISLINALLRFATKASLGWISLLTITSTPKKRAIHDIISGSVLVY